jgi:hypothetical protein
VLLRSEQLAVLFVHRRWCRLLITPRAAVDEDEVRERPERQPPVDPLRTVGVGHPHRQPLVPGPQRGRGTVLPGTIDPQIVRLRPLPPAVVRELVVVEDVDGGMHDVQRLRVGIEMVERVPGAVVVQ